MIALIVAINIKSIASAIEPTQQPLKLERRFGPYYGPIPDEPYSIETRNGNIVTSDVVEHQIASREPAPYFEFGTAQNQFGYGYGFGYGFGPWTGYGWRGPYGFGVPFYRAPFAPYGYWNGFGAVNGYGYPRGFGWAGYPYGFFPGGPYQGYFGPGMIPGYRTYGPYTNSVIVPHSPLVENIAPSDPSLDPQIIQPNNAPVTPPTSPPPVTPENALPGPTQ
jgi:hypothetical protein